MSERAEEGKGDKKRAEKEGEGRLGKATEKKIKEVFRNHENEKREEIRYEETVQDEYTHKWLNHLYYPTNSVKIDL